MLLSTEWPSFHNLMIAYKSCRLHKPAGVSQIRFEMRLAENINNLLAEIHSGRYKPAPAKCFVVTHPKPREIFAADFRDRVVHHLVISQLEPRWERKFIHSSFACRVGKGTHGAIKYAQKKVRSISQGGIRPVWALQLDIEKFFVSIDRSILCDLLLEDVHHPNLKMLIKVIYSHDARQKVKKCGNPALFKLIPVGKSWFDQTYNQGIPIGNLTSQFGANVYLTALDHYIQRQLKPCSYQRYMDDLLLLDLDPSKLEKMIAPIDRWLNTHRLQRLNQKKTVLVRLDSKKITYLGFRLLQTNFDFEPLQFFAEPLKKWRLISSLRKLEQSTEPHFEQPHILAPHLCTKKLQSELTSINSKMGTLIHAKTYHFRKKTLERAIKNTTDHFSLPSEHFNHWSAFKIKKDYRAILLK